jgi:hypothetical protein
MLYNNSVKLSLIRPQIKITEWKKLQQDQMVSNSAKQQLLQSNPVPKCVLRDSV